MDGNGAKLLKTSKLPHSQVTVCHPPVTFDLRPGGPPEKVTWTAPNSGDAFLFLDRNGNGIVDDGGELFGNSTPLLGGGTASNGYIALAEFDLLTLGGNSNGTVDAGDALFPYLGVWVDVNHNGMSESGELRSLSDAGVIALGNIYHHSGHRDSHGNLLRFRGKVWIVNAQGQRQVVQSWDVFLQAAP